MLIIHAQAWDQKVHIAPLTVKVADRSRGYPLNLTVAFDACITNMAPSGPPGIGT